MRFSNGTFTVWRRLNLRCVFCGKADSLPCEVRKETPIFFNYQSYQLPLKFTNFTAKIPTLYNGMLLEKCTQRVRYHCPLYCWNLYMHNYGNCSHCLRINLNPPRFPSALVKHCLSTYIAHLCTLLWIFFAKLVGRKKIIDNNKDGNCHNNCMSTLIYNVWLVI